MSNKKIASPSEISEISLLSKSTNAPLRTIETSAFAELALEHVLELKALDAVVYDVNDSSNIADFILVASGTSNRHTRGIVDNVKEKLSAIGINPDRIEGYQDGEWIVMDYSNVILHIFFEPKRQYFRIDDLFKDQKKMKLKEHLNTQVRALKTGMHSLV